VDPRGTKGKKTANPVAGSLSGNDRRPSTGVTTSRESLTARSFAAART